MQLRLQGNIFTIEFTFFIWPNLNFSLVDELTLPLVPVIVEALKHGDDQALRLVLSIFDPG